MEFGVAVRVMVGGMEVPVTVISRALDQSLVVLLTLTV